MGRILAIDYGRKRIGIAVTDPLKIIATGLKTVRTHEVMDFLTEYTSREEVELIIVGHPKQNDNTDSECMTYIYPFLSCLKKTLPHIPYRLYDERYTSVLAHRALIEVDAKQKTRRNKELIDTMSATILLESYMNYRKI